jgi:hypothetical protein
MGTSCACALTSYRSESERPTEANASGQLQGAQARAATSTPITYPCLPNDGPGHIRPCEDHPSDNNAGKPSAAQGRASSR